MRPAWSWRAAPVPQARPVPEALPVRLCRVALRPAALAQPAPGGRLAAGLFWAFLRVPRAGIGLASRSWVAFGRHALVVRPVRA
jgi:hypothetical protein